MGAGTWRARLSCQQTVTNGLTAQVVCSRGDGGLNAVCSGEGIEDYRVVCSGGWRTMG